MRPTTLPKIESGSALAVATAAWAEQAAAAADKSFRPLPAWEPTARQRMALDSPADELLFGGAAGGGKSEFLLTLARTRHRSSLLLRRTFSELDRNLIPRAKSIFRESEFYNNAAHRWNFPDGRTIQFGHIQREDDFEQYRSDEYDLVGFDELTEFGRTAYEYLFSRLRTTVPGQRVRMVAATNPGGVGAEWVVERWAAWLDPGHPRPAAPGELRYYVRRDGKEVEVDGPSSVKIDGLDVLPQSRTFVPALVSDNPFLGVDYHSRLQALPEPFRSQLLFGDWNIGRGDDADAVIPRGWLRAAMARWAELPDPAPNLSAVGVDVARGGDDRTAWVERRGTWFGRVRTVPGSDTPTGRSVVALFAPLLAEGGVGAVDSIGVGGAVVDAARERGVPVNAVNFGEGTSERDASGAYEFANVRALAYWRLREMLDPGRNDGDPPAQLPNDSELFAELAAPRFSLTASGKIKIEAKDEIKSRLGRSPDKADALALSVIIRKPFDPAAYVRALRGIK